MKQDDLTRLKHIGESRMKLLYNFGITTVEQLYQTPLEKLAQIKSIGAHYAKLIKEAVVEYYEEQRGESSETIKPGKAKKIKKVDRELNKRIKALNKSSGIWQVSDSILQFKLEKYKLPVSGDERSLVIAKFV